MIYNSTVNSFNESEALSLLESVNNRFEYETIGEATAIVVAEQETNWTNFMKGVGLSELATVMEGEEVIYEGARLQAFIDKAIAYFKIALNKLAEITKSFIANIDRFVRTNASFLKKYESDIKKAKLPSDFSFKGYKFSDALNTIPKYATNSRTSDKDFIIGKAERVSKDENNLFKEGAAKKDLVSTNSWANTYDEDDAFADQVFVHYYGSKEKVDIKSSDIDLNKEITYLKKAKENSGNAKKSYTAAHKEISSIIKKLEKAKRNASSKDETNNVTVDSAFNNVLTYWREYSSAATTYHGKYMSALGARTKQAKAVCTKAITSTIKSKGKEQRNKHRKGAGLEVHEEGFVNTDAFLGAVEFF